MAPASGIRGVLAIVPLLLYIAISAGQGPPLRFEYCAVCPPSHRDDLNMSGCNITLLSRADVEGVTVETEDGTQTLSLEAGVPITTTIDPSFHVNEGLEEKGIIISSDEELIVTVYKLDHETGQNRYIDAYQVYDSRLAGYEFFILNKLNQCNSTDYVKSFFSVLSFEDSTFIEIYSPDGTFIAASVINRFQVFTNRTTVEGDDFSGMRIRVHKPALMVTGTLCAGNKVNDIPESYITSLQPALFYGKVYVTPVIGGSIRASYGLRVLGASADGTTVKHEGHETTLARGEFLEFEYPVNDLATQFECSEPCLVVEWSDGPDIGNFMFNVFAEEQYTRIATFLTLDFEGEHWVSIVVNGYPPMDDIFLNGQDLYDETWRVRGTYSYTELQIEPGVHTLNVAETSEKMFGAYVYCHIDQGTGGYGYSVFPQDIENLPSPPTTVITTPDPSEDYEYVVVCPPHQMETNIEDTACEISITAAKENALVNISASDNRFMQEYIEAFRPFTLTLNYTYIATQGHESKAILIRSTSQLTVVVYKLDLVGNVFIDATQIYSLEIAGFDHIIMAPSNGCPNSSLINSFYTLAGHWEGTFVEIFDEQNQFMEAVVLNKYQAYTVHSKDSGVDFTGRYMRSIYPVTAIAGTLCAENVGQNVQGTYFTSLPAVIHYGYNFTTPNMHEPSSGSYGLRILAAEDFTRVIYGDEGTTIILSARESVTLNFNYTSISTPVTCDRPCLVEQFTTSRSGMVIGNFMFNLIPSEQFYKEAYFTTSNLPQKHYISIVVLGLPPMTDILLDGDDLNDRTWRWFGSYTYTDMEVTAGKHSVTSAGDKSFAVYVYSHTDSGGGFGYPIWPDGQLVGSTGSPPTVPPTRAPLPSYEITMNATSQTSTGLPPEETCESYYRIAMRLKGSEIADRINEGLGTEYCVDIRGNIVIATVEVELTIEGSVIRIDEIFDIPGQRHHRPYQLETCGEEIALYLSDMGNWDQPLVPGQGECAPLTFAPQRFDTKSLLWRCAEDTKEELFIEIPHEDDEEEEDENYGLDTGDAGDALAPPRAENDLLFTNTITETLQTADEENIDNCHNDYAAAVRAMGDAMEEDLIANPRTNCTESQLLRLQTHFSSQQTLAYLSYTFVYSPGTETFRQMEDCFDDLEDYLVAHASWGDPLVPPIAGCPDLEPLGEEFERGNNEWLCQDGDNVKQTETDAQN